MFCPFIDREYRPGDVLYREGESADYVWYVKSGAVVLRHPGGDVHKPAGSFVGLESLLRGRYDATAEVADDATLCGGTRAGFAQWLGPESERTCAVLRTLLPVLETTENHEEKES